MKKILTAAMLLLAGHTFAQNNEGEAIRPAPTAVQRNFDMPADWINIRDYIYLPNKAKMIVELTHAEQYNELKYIDTMLTALLRDIAFYTDSLSNHTGSIRIDYTQDDGLGIRKLRFKKHPADGISFMSRNDEKAKLKIDQDTIRIYVRHSPLTPTTTNKHGKMTNIHYREMYSKAQLYQVTLCVNNYTDIMKIAADKQTMQHAIDTMMATKRRSTRADPYKFPSSALYNPYATRDDIHDRFWRAVSDVRFKQYGGLLRSEAPENWRIINRSDKLIVDGSIGIGLLRNYLAPTADIGLYISSRSRRPINGAYREKVFGINASCAYLFDRGANNEYYSKPNWFINATFAEQDDFGIGAGYLLHSKGDFFKGTTTKLFLNVKPWKKGPTLSPELIFTNNFRQVIPAFTLKIF